MGNTESSLVRCTNCQLILTNPRLANDSLGLLFPDGVRIGQSRDLFRRRWRWLEHLALRNCFGYPDEYSGFFAHLLANLGMLKFHSRDHRRDWIPFRAPGRLLDIGCTSATFLERMQAFGWTVTGLDYDEEITHRVRNQNGIQIQQGTLPHPNLLAGSFDAVTMRQVLEHMPRPRQSIVEAARLLRPGGLLIIEVPNIESQTFAEFELLWCGLDLANHVQHFSPRTLSAMIPTELLQIAEIQQVGMRSWIKQSAQRAVAAGLSEYRSWLSKGKSFWMNRALRSENAHQADVIRLIAERRA